MSDNMDQIREELESYALELIKKEGFSAGDPRIAEIALLLGQSQVLLEGYAQFIDTMKAFEVPEVAVEIANQGMMKLWVSNAALNTIMKAIARAGEEEFLRRLDLRDAPLN